MLGKKIGFVKRLTNKIKVRGCASTHDVYDPLRYECLQRSDLDDNKQAYQSCGTTPRGCIALYVGEEKTRFVVQTSYLSHPLFHMLLEKMAEEFGFEQKDRLVVPCSVDVFRDVISAVECNNGRFDLRYFVD
ncbi:auxin-responsive protein SAUR15-like [Rutidosis leptorrhynchoides]|uniref:auxin-responsive protein SAUR15-like n=1 Tax=Rutidosis leptorrhynchoides TaxID=125765 RepID=UPI003A98E83A